MMYALWRLGHVCVCVLVCVREKRSMSGKIFVAPIAN